MHSSDYVITCNFGGWFNILSLCQLFIYTKHIHTISTYTVLAVSIAIWNCSIVSCSCMNLIHSLASQRLEWKCRISVCFIEFRLENCLIIKKKWKFTFLVVVLFCRSGHDTDYLNLALRDGGVSLTMGLANGKQEMHIKPARVRFDDHQWHKVTVHRRIQEVSNFTFSFPKCLKSTSTYSKKK